MTDSITDATDATDTTDANNANNAITTNYSTLYSNIKLFRSKDYIDSFFYLRDICPDNELTLIASYQTIVDFYEELGIILKDYRDRINIIAILSNGDTLSDFTDCKIDLPVFYTGSWTEKCLLIRNKGNNAEILYSEFPGLDTFLSDQFRLN